MTRFPENPGKTVQKSADHAVKKGGGSCYIGRCNNNHEASGGHTGNITGLLIRKRSAFANSPH
ncbi:MAG: hypothetical protein K1W37_07725 [Lachnospiraceae bacterium]